MLVRYIHGWVEGLKHCHVKFADFTAVSFVFVL